MGRCLNGCILRRDRGRGDTRLVDRTDAAINEAIAADPGVHNVVAGYSDLVSPLAGAVIGTITVPTMRTRAGVSGFKRRTNVVALPQRRGHHTIGRRHEMIEQDDERLLSTEERFSLRACKPSAILFRNLPRSTSADGVVR